MMNQFIQIQNYLINLSHYLQYLHHLKRLHHQNFQYKKKLLKKNNKKQNNLRILKQNKIIKLKSKKNAKKNLILK